jgi:hypothetical protein
MKTRFFLIYTVLLIPTFPLIAQNFTEKQKIVASDRDTSAYFGSSAGIYGNYAVVGTSSEDFDSAGNNELENAGAAYIFERNIYGNWNPVKKISSSDREAGDNFGLSTAIYGNHTAIGSPAENTDSLFANPEPYAGSVYIFRRNSLGTWMQNQKISAPDRDDEDKFGYSIALNKDFMVIGASEDEHDTLHLNAMNEAGSAYIYEKQDSQWNFIQKIIASDRDIGDFFGSAAGISDKFIIIGAPDEDDDTIGGNALNNAGSAYIFEIDTGTSSVRFVQKIVASDRDADDYFGYRVGITNDYAVIGAFREQHDENDANPIVNAGSAYIFARNDANGRWNFLQKIVPSNRTEITNFGASVSIENNTIIVGASYINTKGAAYVFKRDVTGYFSESQILLPQNAAEINMFGYAVSLAGEDILISAPTDCYNTQGNDSIQSAGSAYIFNACSPSGFNRSDNIIVNGEFENCNLDPWTVSIENNTCMADAFLLNGECKFVPFDVRTSGADPWDIQIKQEFTPAQIGLFQIDTLYSFSFYARAESDHRPCHVYLGENEDPWTPLIDHIAYFDREMKEYNYEFHAQAFNSMKVSFELGLDDAPVTIDSVYLRKQVWPSNPLGTGSYFNDLVNIYPIPANDYLNVKVEAGTIISIYNPSGQQILQRISTQNPEIIDVSSFPEGLYLVKLNGKNQTAVKKLIIN